MPGAWPSEPEEEDNVEAAAMNYNMTFSNQLGTNLYNVVTYLRDSSYSLCTALGNKIFHPGRHISIGLASDDGERASKRRRLEEPPSTPNAGRIVAPAGPIDDPMDIDGPIDAEDRNIKTESFPDYPMDMGERDIKIEISSPHTPVISPNSTAAAAAVKRAIQLFPVGRRIPPKRSPTQICTPHEDREEESITKTEQSPEQNWRPLGKPRYSNIHEFFEHDHELCLPGLEAVRLTPNDTKVYELDSLREERLRLEKEKAEKERQERLRIEEERLNEGLRPLGLRRPRSPLITPLDDEWERRARDAPDNGHAEENKWKGARHRDGVELTPRDFARLVPPSAWLNDNAIQAALVHLATFINDAAGVVPKSSIPKCVALSSQYWSSFLTDPKKNLFPRGLSRNWGMNKENFLDIDTVLIPVNEGNHWTLLVIRPSRRTIAYVDSFHSAGPNHIKRARTFLETLLENKYAADDWKVENYTVPQQMNGYDCGIFVITNSIYLALGIDPSSYSQEDMPLQRRRIAAMLLNGGFTGPFDLSRL